MELGIYTFADMTREPVSGEVITAQQRISNLMEEIELADQVALDVYAIGEHHRPDYAVSAPAIVLGAAAVKTKSIKLSSAVTVLSSDDPVRVFQNFATVDLLSKGRAEIMAGRGSFIESFPLFGYKMEDYDELFEEKLQLLIKLNENETVNWKGNHRAPISNLGVYPRPFQSQLPIWVAVGGTPQSIIRAATLKLPMALAIIGGEPRQFVQHIQLYRDTIMKAGVDKKDIRLGINSHVFVGDDSKTAADQFYPSYADMMNRLGKERGWSPMSRNYFEALTNKHGALVVGSPQQVIDKILYGYELFQNTRFLAQMSVGTVPHAQLMRSIELFGTVVAPAVRKAISA